MVVAQHRKFGGFKEMNRSESEIRQRLQELKETWDSDYKRIFDEAGEEYSSMDTGSIIDAARIEREITTLQWVLGLEMMGERVS